MKDSFYFPHDYHARHDPKLEKLRIVLGCEGLGVYWCLVEMLYEENGSLAFSDIEIYAKSLGANAECLTRIVNEFNLFRKNKTHFFSESVLKRLKHINSKREKARASAKLSHSANAERTQSERSAIKESKVKESKVKNIVDVKPENRAEVVAVFEKWNNSRLISHKDIKKFAGSIQAALSIYPLADILTAIENYSTVLNEEKYFWTYKWTLDQFLGRKGGIDRFMPQSFKPEDYLKKEFKALTETNSSGYDAETVAKLRRAGIRVK